MTIETNEATQVEELKSLLTDMQAEMKAGNDKTAENMNDKLTEMQVELKALQIANKRSAVNDELSEHKEEFKQHGDAIRSAVNGTLESKADLLNTVSLEEGGFTVNPSLEQAIVDLVQEASPARSYMNVMSMNSAEYNFNMKASHATAKWAGELDARTGTQSPTFKRGKIIAHDLFAYTTLSDVMVEDSGFDIQSYVNSDVQNQFAIAENLSYLKGTGNDNNQPTGLESYVGGTEEGQQNVKEIVLNGSVPTVDELIDIVHDIKPIYRQKAVWVMNRSTLAAVRKIRDADGDLLFHYATQLDAPAVIGKVLGFNVIEDEAVSSGVGEVGIYFGDLKGFTIFDRQGLKMQSDMGILAPGFKSMYTRKRVGSGLISGQGIRGIRFS